MAKAGSQSPVNGAGGRRTRVPRPEDLGYRKGKRSHKSQAALEVPDLIAPLTIRLGGALKSWTGESMRSSILCDSFCSLGVSVVCGGASRPKNGARFLIAPHVALFTTQRERSDRLVA
jgi:hypothetical protein